jgi:xylulose-5-phosphate/fructose-6-phosphate phosphoketolase
MKRNMTSFRVFGPDETASNKLDGIYAASKKTWVSQFEPEDADGTEIAADGRVMEMLSEHTLEGWFEGYVLTGRHGFFSTYESFVHVIDSMFNQHAKWLEKSKELGWRAPIASIYLLITSLVWRQDHNGFTHQDPGFLDVVTNKSPDVVRIYLPPDANCLLSVADHCLRSKDYYNVIVADKQPHLTFLDMDAAVEHCTKGELAIINQVDRFNLAIDVIDRVPRLQKTAAHVKDWLKSQIVDQLNYAYAEGIDREAIRNWIWPG